MKIQLTILFGLLAVFIAGCSTSGGGSAQVARDEVPPAVSGFAITPPQGNWRGGPCQITLHATDNQQVASVTARLDGPASGTAPIPLTLVSGDLYQGTATAPANTNADGSVNTYTVTAWAVDNAGNSTSVQQSLSFTVPAPTAPGPPPQQW